MKNIITKIVALIYFTVLTVSLHAQNNLGIGTNSPDASAMLEILSNDKGFLAPRMTTAERLAIPTPANALLVFDKDSACFYYYDSIAIVWINLCNAFVETDPIFGSSVASGISMADTAYWNAIEAIANAYTDAETAARIADVDAEEARALAAEAALSTAINNHITADLDLDSTNELQTLSILGSDITLSDGGGTVSVPSSADNLGNHSATTTLNLNDNWLTVKPNITSDTADIGISWNGTSDSYGIYKEAGAWSSPYPDLMIRFHTGIKLSAESAYGGVRVYANNSENLTATFNNSGLTLTSLTGTGNRMVIANATGNLSTQAIPGGDNLGNHIATTTLNLNNQNITSVKDVFTNNYGTGMVGVYSSSRYQHIFSMGSAYRLAADGTAPGNMYGLAWTHSNVAGESIAGLGHQLLLMTNGDTRTALGDGVWTKYDITGNRFVDQNNTSYYADPASISQFNDMRANIYYDRNNTSFYLDPSSTSNVNDIIAENIGIRKATPNTDLHIKQFSQVITNGTGGIKLEESNTTDFWRIYHSGIYLSFNVNGTRVAYINDASGAWTTTSDRRFKKDIEPMENVLDRVMKLNAVKYRYNHNSDNDIKQRGFIAQDVQEVFPDLISTEDGTQFALARSDFGILAIKAIQEQQQQIEEQKMLIYELMQRLDKLDNK